MHYVFVLFLCEPKYTVVCSSYLIISTYIYIFMTLKNSTSTKNKIRIQ